MLFIIETTKEYEAVIDEFIIDNPDIEIEKSISRSFNGVAAVDAVIGSKSASRVIKLVDMILKHREAMIMEENRHKEAEQAEANRYSESLRSEENRHKEAEEAEKNRHIETCTKEKNIHEEEIYNQNYAQFSVVCKKDDYDVSTLMKVTNSDSDAIVQSGRESLVKIIDDLNQRR